MISRLLQVHGTQVGPVDPAPDAPPLPGGAAEIVRFFMDVPQWIQIGGVFLGAITAIVLVILGVRYRRETVAWVLALPSPVKALALAVIVAGGAVASVAGYQVYDFVEHDNRFCTGCHIMADAYLRFEESPHAVLGCKECHAQPRSESARQLYLWVLDRPHEVGGGHAPVADARCTSCHVDGDPDEWPQIAASLGHRVHFESDHADLGELMCVTCHGVEVHEFSPAEQTCGECHEAEASIRLGAMAAETELHCVACHDFLRDEPATLEGIPEGLALLPERAQCQACHDMAALLPEGELDGDPHGAVCGACHNPHTQDTPADAVQTCAGCHQASEQLTIYHTGTHAPIHAQCAACHEAHSWRVEGTDCLSCHETVLGAREENGPVRTIPWANLARHQSVAPPPSGSPPPSPSPPPPYHPSPSEEAPEGRPAAVSRAPTATVPSGFLVTTGTGDRVGADRRGTSATDTLPRPFLHREHETLSCTQCHGTADEHGVLTVRTAQECAACHHDPVRGYSCESCHPATGPVDPRPVPAPMDLTVWDGPRSRDLPFDHQLHEEITCQECHTGPVFMAVETTCAACHEDHHRPNAECSQCHQPAEEGVHGLEVHLTCTSSGCHAGTAGERPALTRTLCLTCHTDQRDHEPGLTCQDCHMIPQNPPVRPILSESATRTGWFRDLRSGLLASLDHPGASMKGMEGR